MGGIHAGKGVKMKYSKPVVICEIGCNHKGDMETALDMIRVAAQFCKVDVVKFQKRSPRELLSPEDYSAPHPNPANSYGDTYGAHREFLEFDLDQNRRLKEEAEAWKIDYSTSVWDMTSAREMTSLNPRLLKIPSACNTNLEMLGYLCDEYGGEIHVSLGMTTHLEEEKIVSLFESKSRSKDLILYACTSGYPVPDEDVCLLEITRLREAYGSRIKSIGFSGHHLGISIDIGALVLGVGYVERHFTLDRTWKGTDHAASLEPDGMRRLCRDLDSVSKALTYKPAELLEIEGPQRKKLKWSAS